jgi:tRNA A-37 threonylcarbamoyl transferase component Bud32
LQTSLTDLIRNLLAPKQGVLCCEAAFASTFAKLGLDHAEGAIRFFTEGEKKSPKRSFIASRTLPLAGGGALNVIYKQYQFRKPSWKFWTRKSKARREYENYQSFVKIGIRTALPIAWGERRDWIGRLSGAFVVTSEISNAETLLEFFAMHDRSNAASRALRRSLIRELALMTRRSHQAGFFHNDLHWRNILVEGDGFGQRLLSWIDCPRGCFRRSILRERYRLKDLACLDKSAEAFCSQSERLLFLKTYLNKSHLDEAAKRLVRKIRAYRRKRWLLKSAL